ncbi:MAG: hypothetical protein Q8O67_26185 [Deltaproteobacteria bacterium]|nr:hypothetical protein [Deltaproteobacteria bacterium]
MATRRTPGRDGAGPKPPEEPSSGRTQRLPRMLVEPSSLEVSIAFMDEPNDDATQPTLSRPSLIVMEERPVGLADALAKMGFLVRPAQTGVETMSLVAERAPNAVIAGPGDPERRRVLTGALRLRFPHVAVVLVLQKVDDAVVDAARREGAHAVLTWPLPAPSEVYAAIPAAKGASKPVFDDVTAAPMLAASALPPVRVQSSGSAPKTMVTPPSSAPPPLQSSVEERAMYSADGSAEASMLGEPMTSSMPTPRPHVAMRSQTEISPQRPPTLPAEFLTPLPMPPAPPAQASPPPEATRTMLQPRLDVTGTPARPRGIMRRPPTSTSDDLATLNVVRVNVPLTREGDENVETSPGKPAADVQDAIAPRGEIRDVLLAVAPFLWGLDDCARYLEDLHGHHVAGADVHARTVRLVARLLAQLQARVDEI